MKTVTPVIINDNVFIGNILLRVCTCIKCQCKQIYKCMSLEFYNKGYEMLMI